jgi:hypothetical protein
MFSKDYIWPKGSKNMKSALNLHCLWETARWSNLMTGKAKISIELINENALGMLQEGHD